ncbi:MAG: hypothetical protein RBS73_13350 [Prolixibacteraceae bacterium]|nr:hypothetical protein [Prolixibacteraceae bacterium]
MLQHLKDRWNIGSNFQVILILLVFAITGSSSLWVKNQVFGFIGIDDTMHYFFRLLLGILIITPVYQVLLLAVAALFGQFGFFWEFEKRMVRRFRKKPVDP